MQVYSVDSGDIHQFVGKLEDAKAIIKQASPVFRASIAVELLEIPTDKENFLAILNESSWRSVTVRKWRGTARGGLKLVEPA